MSGLRCHEATAASPELIEEILDCCLNKEYKPYTSSVDDGVNRAVSVEEGISPAKFSEVASCSNSPT